MSLRPKRILIKMYYYRDGSRQFLWVCRGCHKVDGMYDTWDQAVANGLHHKQRCKKRTRSTRSMFTNYKGIS